MKLQQILYRSKNRGCKETCLILGNFYEKNINNLTPDEIIISEEFLNEDDLDIFNWIINQESLPKKYLSLIKKILIK